MFTCLSVLILPIFQDVKAQLPDQRCYSARAIKYFVTTCSKSDLLVDSAADTSGYLSVVFGMMGQFTETRFSKLDKGRDTRDIVGRL